MNALNAAAAAAEAATSTPNPNTNTNNNTQNKGGATGGQTGGVQGGGGGGGVAGGGGANAIGTSTQMMEMKNDVTDSTNAAGMDALTASMSCTSEDYYPTGELLFLLLFFLLLLLRFGVCLRACV